MKKVLLLSMMAGIALASCSDNGDEPGDSSRDGTKGYANVGFRVVRVFR